IDDANRSGHALKGVATDREGMRPDVLDRAAVETGARVVFVQPTIHNPTCTTMSEARRREIVAVARRRNLLIVEDDVYGLLPERRPPPIAALAPERTIYITSGSKALAQGVRVVSASSFTIGREVAPHAVRVSLAAAQDQPTLVRALTTLAELAQSRPGVRRAV